MNTVINYFYRDGDNYKSRLATVVVAGEIKEHEFRSFCEENEGFIASDIGLSDLQNEMTSFPSNVDHVYSELDSIKLTDAKPTISMTAEQVMAKLQEINNNWKVDEAMERLGIPRYNGTVEEETE
jgi:hypothetical protein